MGRTCGPVLAQIDGLVEASSPWISSSSSCLDDPSQVHGVVFRCCPFVSQQHYNLLRAIAFPLANFFALTMVENPGSSPSPSTGVKNNLLRPRLQSNMSWSPRFRFLFLHVRSRHRGGQTQSKSLSRTNNNAEYVGSPLLLSAFRFGFHSLRFPAHKNKSKKSG